MSGWSLSENLRDKEDYQEILLINGFDEVIEDEFEHFNSRARMRKRSAGYFYNTKDKNIYLNELVVNPYGGGYRTLLLINYDSYENELKFKAAAKKSDWILIYEHTKFLITGSSGSAWFSFQFLPKEAHFLARPFAIISAENPSMGVQSESLNQRSNELMKKTLSGLGYEFYPTVGELSGHVENSFIVYNIDKDDAFALGEKFMQESILFNDGTSIEILQCSNKKPVLSFEFKGMY